MSPFIRYIGGTARFYPLHILTRCAYTRAGNGETAPASLNQVRTFAQWLFPAGNSVTEVRTRDG